ncbi:MAG: DUF6152 family protein [Hyphomonadaceae bacterium]|jgi:hypothetical protein|nr:DUF6152 family protein [Hyphomonadaceae bacterium]
MSKNRLTAALTVAAATLTTVTVAIAHHGRNGAYDVSRPIALEGVITEASFAPPHPVITIRVDARPRAASASGMPGYEGAAAINRAADAGAVRVIEFSPLPQFTALRDSVTVGQRIQIMAFRNCIGTHDLRGHWVRTAGGVIAQRDNRPTSAVNGCPPARPS